ncbi:MAG: hypothetical protein ACE37E_11190 [Hyphomicrobiales bacterium]
MSTVEIRREYTNPSQIEYYQQCIDWEQKRLRLSDTKMHERIERTVDGHIESIRYAEDGAIYRRPSIDKRMLSFFKSGERKPLKVINLVDAYLQIIQPGINSYFEDLINISSTGLPLAAFLKEPLTKADRYQLSLYTQSLVGSYKFTDVNTHQALTDDERYLVIREGSSIDFLTCIDARIPKRTRSTRNLSHNALAGFIIPGDQLSPVILRSVKYHRRQVGLIYTPGKLVDAAGGVFDRLRYEVFTTDLGQQGRLDKSSRYGGDFAKALELHYGPKLRRDLERISNQDEVATIKEYIGNFNLNWI